MDKNKEEGAEIWGLLSAEMSSGSKRQETVLREWEEQKTRLKGFFFFSLQMALFLSVPPSQ